jgi:hypothetical protein
VLPLVSVCRDRGRAVDVVAAFLENTSSSESEPMPRLDEVGGRRQLQVLVPDSYPFLAEDDGGIGVI